MLSEPEVCAETRGSTSRLTIPEGSGERTGRWDSLRGRTSEVCTPDERVARPTGMTSSHWSQTRRPAACWNGALLGPSSHWIGARSCHRDHWHKAQNSGTIHIGSGSTRWVTASRRDGGLGFAAASWSRPATHSLDTAPATVAEFDVLVAGGGVAGFAAAIAAAERGSSVGLIERNGFSGGQTVGGLSGTICGLYLSSETRGNGPEQLVFGMAERFRTALEAEGGITTPDYSGKTWSAAHDPVIWARLADDMLATAGVEVLYHATVTGVVMDGPALQGVAVQSKLGPGTVRAGIVIDATGDADVAYLAGLETTIGVNGRVQNPTMMFRLINADVAKFMQFRDSHDDPSDALNELVDAARATGRYDLPRREVWVKPTPIAGQLHVNATRLLDPVGRPLLGIDPADLTLAEQVGRRQVGEYARFLRDYVPGLADTRVDYTGTHVGIRQTRSIVGVKTLRDEDVLAGRKPRDGIVRSAWPIEAHDGEVAFLHFNHGDYYEVPYHCLVPKEGENLIVAGRCISAEHRALASARVVAQCFGYGEAAGAAAAMALDSHQTLRRLDGRAVRAEIEL